MNFQEAFYRLTEGELITKNTWEDSYLCLYDYNKIEYTEVYFSSIQCVHFDKDKVRHFTPFIPTVEDVIFGYEIWGIYPDDNERIAFRKFHNDWHGVEL